MVWGKVLNPGGTTLASEWWDGTIQLWWVSDDELGHTLEEHTAWVDSVAFSPDGTMLVPSGARDSIVQLWGVW